MQSNENLEINPEGLNTEMEFMMFAYIRILEKKFKEEVMLRQQQEKAIEAKNQYCSKLKQTMQVVEDMKNEEVMILEKRINYLEKLSKPQAQPVLPGPTQSSYSINQPNSHDT